MSLVRTFYGSDRRAYPAGHALSDAPASPEDLAAPEGAAPPAQPIAVPDGRPESFWTLAQLNAWATARDVVLPEGLKPAKVEAAQLAWELEQEKAEAATGESSEPSDPDDAQTQLDIANNTQTED